MGVGEGGGNRLGKRNILEIWGEAHFFRRFTWGGTCVGIIYLKMCQYYDMTEQWGGGEVFERFSRVQRDCENFLHV